MSTQRKTAKTRNPDGDDDRDSETEAAAPTSAKRTVTSRSSRTKSAATAAAGDDGGGAPARSSKSKKQPSPPPSPDPEPTEFGETIAKLAELRERIDKPKEEHAKEIGELWKTRKAADAWLIEHLSSQGIRSAYFDGPDGRKLVKLTDKYRYRAMNDKVLDSALDPEFLHDIVEAFVESADKGKEEAEADDEDEAGAGEDEEEGGDESPDIVEFVFEKAVDRLKETTKTGSKALTIEDAKPKSRLRITPVALSDASAVKRAVASYDARRRLAAFVKSTGADLKQYRAICRVNADSLAAHLEENEVQSERFKVEPESDADDDDAGGGGGGADEPLTRVGSSGGGGDTEVANKGAVYTLVRKTASVTLTKFKPELYKAIDGFFRESLGLDEDKTNAKQVAERLRQHPELWDRLRDAVRDAVRTSQEGAAEAKRSVSLTKAKPKSDASKEKARQRAKERRAAASASSAKTRPGGSDDAGLARAATTKKRPTADPARSADVLGPTQKRQKA